MAHNFTVIQRIRGVRSAIASPRTPEHLRQPLVRQLRKLEAGRPAKIARHAKKRVGLLDWLAL
jgi:hypothetical protein